MSNSSARRVSLSIVVASNGAPGSVAACLESLEGQVDGAEVLVCAPEASYAAVRRRFSFARFLHTVSKRQTPSGCATAYAWTGTVTSLQPPGR
jgi:hypothetical protein